MTDRTHRPVRWTPFFVGVPVGGITFWLAPRTHGWSLAVGMIACVVLVAGLAMRTPPVWTSKTLVVGLLSILVMTAVWIVLLITIFIIGAFVSGSPI